MIKKQYEKILAKLLSTGADFAEIFHEKSKKKSYQYIDNKLETIMLDMDQGLGLRIAKNNQIYSGETNSLTEEEINTFSSNLASNFSLPPVKESVVLQELEVLKSNAIIKELSDQEIRNKLKLINDKIRNSDSRIEQVSIHLKLSNSDVVIANHTGMYREEERLSVRLYISVNFADQELKSSVSFSKGASAGLELFDSFSIDEILPELIQTGIDKLYAKPCVGKNMPVILNHGFGGVLFHEACGHALEATAVANNQSVLTHDYNKIIATEKVTIIDDGSLLNAWGSTKMDDEGKDTQKNILIQDGVLVSFLVDELNARKMNTKSTASARRESYLYPPTSRMNNTYLAPGNDSIEDMFQGVKLGLYAKNIGGGCVDTETGDFNFVVSVGYMIRDGKIAECVKSASLIGNTKDLLMEVEMVSDDLELSEGMCGSQSGWVPVNVGQPTIKLGHILVGGEKDE